MQRCFKTNQELVRGTSNLLVERFVVIKTDVFFVSLKEEIPNKSVSETLETLPLKIFSSMLRMLVALVFFNCCRYLAAIPGCSLM